MFCIVDCNNFWNPDGGGVRRYHLEKMAFYKERPEVKYVFIMNDGQTYTEQIGENAFIEHIRVKPLAKSSGGYRTLLNRKILEKLLLKFSPDVIEVGSPYILPYLVNKTLKKRNMQAKVFGFWHADFPITYIERNSKFFGINFSKIMEKFAWAHARTHFNKMTGTLVSSQIVKERMKLNGIQNVHYLPLGIDHQIFNEQARNTALLSSLKMDKSDRLTMFYGHRLSNEKGIDLLMEAYPIVCAHIGYEPALEIAGHGPLEEKVRKFASQNQHVHYIGYLENKEELATHQASADLGFALSAWETFGLAIIESYACNTPVISANDGAALEHALNVGSSYILNIRTSQALADLIIEFEENKKKTSFNLTEYAQKFAWESCFERQLELYKQG